MIKTIVIAVLVLLVVPLAAILVFAATKPDTFRVQRMTSIQAPPERIFPLINDFHRWTHWSPWEKLDPNLKRTYSGAEQGVGASYEWSGNAKAGAGKMTIKESTPNQHIVIELLFTKPFAANNKGEFTLSPKDGGTEVVWTMSGQSNFVAKLFSVFMDMDKVVGAQFDEGLANLGRVAGGGGGEKQLSPHA